MGNIEKIKFVCVWDEYANILSGYLGGQSGLH